MTIHACLLYQGAVITAAMRLDEAIISTSRHIAIQMFDEHGEAIPQPYPDTDDMVTFRQNNNHPALWIVNIHDPPPGFTFQDIHPATWHEALQDKECKTYDAETGDVVLAPGYKKLKNGRVDKDQGPALKEAHIAFGGLRLWKVADGIRGMAIDTDLPMAGDPLVLTNLKDKLKVRKEKEKAARGNETDAGQHAGPLRDV